MESQRKKCTDREKTEAATRLLEKLREQLHSSNASNRRRAAFNLSWMQEDGLEILRGALLGEFLVTTKNAAAYGLRNMRGRMKKMALEVLRQGLERRDSSTRETCRNALQLLGEMVPGQSVSRRQPAVRLGIREIPRKSRPRQGLVRGGRRNRSL